MLDVFQYSSKRPLNARPAPPGQCMSSRILPRPALLIPDYSYHRWTYRSISRESSAVSTVAWVCYPAKTIGHAVAELIRAEY